MWTPNFAFDWRQRDEDEEDRIARPPVTAIAMLRAAIAVGVVAVAVFAWAPDLDLACARLFYLGNRHFMGNEGVLFPLIRWTFIVFFYLTCTVTLLGLAMSVRKAGPWLDLTKGKWLFMALCLITGPLVVANIGFKDHWGRARPKDVIEFSGHKLFTAPFPPAGQCDYNCSFVSGEASSVFIVLFAAALLFKAYSRNFVALGIILGGLAGLTRMTQGGHFLSDVIFAGVLMAVTAACMQIVFEILEAEHTRPVKPAMA
ncbi:MAG: phosphatase PAP2 family protein [Hyphomicrobium sp.]|uniref:phosphatase PAP2 family protein n=1 Tax=Hyphomicrobium sp. TaxID=82 RepID=UPI0039E4A564